MFGGEQTSVEPLTRTVLVQSTGKPATSLNGICYNE